jgi:hypothetical protein
MPGETSTIVTIVAQFGFPIIAAIAQGFLLYYIWDWIIKEAKPVLATTLAMLIDLIDKIRVLDNDLIRLQQKLDTVISLRNKNNKE